MHENPLFVSHLCPGPAGVLPVCPSAAGRGETQMAPGRIDCIGKGAAGFGGHSFFVEVFFMCGIAGFCQLEGDLLQRREFWTDVLVEMRKSLAHRGRDQTGE